MPKRRAKRIIVKSPFFPRFPEDLFIPAIEGEVELYWANAKMSLSIYLTPDQRSEFESAKERGYLKLQGRNKASERLRYAWFYWCENNGHPYIWAQLNRKYADIRLDLIAQDWKLTEEAKDSIFHEVMTELAEENAGRKGARVTGGTTSIWFSGFKHEFVDRIARVLLQKALESKQGEQSDEEPE